MSCIHFKFKSSLEYEKLTFDGLHISLSDLKEAIMKQKKIGSFNQYTLSVVDAQSRKEYSNEQEMIPRNTSVIISRVPLTNPTRVPKAQRKDLSLSQPESVAVTTTSASSSLPPPLTSQRQLTVNELQETADLASANASEEDKVAAMMNQSSKDYDPSRYVTVPTFKGPSLASMKKLPPPSNYICHRCGKKGHWIQFCPTNGDPTFDNRTFRRSLGTPASQIISVSTNMPGVMLDRHGNLVMRAVDYEAIKAAQSKKKSEAPVKLELPSELTCPICKKLVKDAVIIQCCGGSFCYDCIQEFLCENEFTCPLCKETNVSPETLVPNKALRTAAKNFQMKESEQKSVSEARGYVPIVAPQPAVPNVHKRLTAVTASTSAVSSATVKPTDASVEAQSTKALSTKALSTKAQPTKALSTKAQPTKALSTKVEEKKEGASKSRETETESKGGADQLAVKAKEERAPTPESRVSPTPQQQKMKNKSEALLDRILSSSAKTTSKRTPPPAPPTSAPVTVTPPAPPISAPTTTTAAPSVSSTPTPVSTAPSVSAGGPPVADVVSTSRLPPTVASAVAGTGLTAPSVPAVAGTGLTAPSVPAVAGTGLTAPSVAAASALLSSSGILGLSRGPTSSALPGQGAVLTTSAVLPPVVITEPGASQEDTAKLERIAAELLLSSAAAVKKSSSPPPLSAEEFYRHQKILKLFTKQSRKRTPTPYSGTSDSRSSTPGSSLSYRSFSGSGSVSRSRSPSESSYSDDRSRSRSPIASHRSHRSKKKHRSRHKRERARQEKSKERGREKKSGHHSKQKRKRHLSPDVKERETKSKHSKSHFHHSRSPNRKKHKDNRISTTLAEGMISPESSVGTPTPDMDVESHEKLSSSRHKHYHRRRGRTKHRHTDRSEERLKGTERWRSTETQRTGDNVQLDDSKEGVKQIHAQEMELGTQAGEVSPEKEEDRQLTTNEKLQRGGAQMIKSGDEEVADSAEINVTNLVPYQDSSTTEVEGVDEEKSQTTTDSNQGPAALADTAADKTITETELTMIESTRDSDHHGDGKPIKHMKVSEEGKAVEVPTKGEEPNENELAEDSLMISLHVDDTIDGTATELVDAECPMTQKAGKEDGELTDSSNGEEDNLFDSPGKAATRSASLSSHTTTGQRSSASDSIGSQPTVVTQTSTALAEEKEHGREKEDDMDLRVVLEQQKSSKLQKPVASAVTIASGGTGKFMSSSKFHSSSVDSDWVSDDEEDRDLSCSTSSSEELEKVRTSKPTSSSKHLSSSLKKHKRKHSSNKSHRDKEREKKRKRRKEYKASGESKKKARKERDRDKDREKERAKKRKKHKKSDKYVKYSH